MDYMPFIWIAVIILSAVIEAFTAQLVSIWFILGAVVALIISLFTTVLWVQILVFISVALLTLLITRPIVNKAVNFEKVSTNADRYIGKIGIVTEEVNNRLGVGQVNVSGSTWTAISADDSIIEVNQSVLIESIEGVKLKVRVIDKN